MLATCMHAANVLSTLCLNTYYAWTYDNVVTRIYLTHLPAIALITFPLDATSSSYAEFQA